jgi:hypothetical protein
MTETTEVDVGEYFESLREEQDVPKHICNRLPPEGNYGRVADKEELAEGLLNLVTDEVRMEVSADNGHIYLDGPEAFLFKVEFLKRGDIDEVKEYRRKAPGLDDMLLNENCMLCGEDHFHDVKPEVMLGGVAEYECPCNNSYAPDIYYLMLFHMRVSVPHDMINWARGELMDNDGWLKTPLLPEEVTAEDIQMNKICGW